MKEHLHFDETLTKREFGYSNIWSSGSSWQKPEIGVIGAAGELGRKLSFQIDQHLPGLVGFDPEQRPLDEFRQGVDPQLQDKLSNGNGARWVQDVNDLVDDCAIVHLCAPLKVIDEVKFSPRTMLVLHDSVMSSSIEAARRLRNRRDFLGSIAVVHCLMNTARTVDINAKSDNIARICRHIDAIGLKPKVTTTEEHDIRMARTQGRLILSRRAFHNHATKYNALDQLTLSGSEELDLFDNRAAVWTKGTEESALRNPFLPQVLVEMCAEIAKTSRTPLNSVIDAMRKFAEGFNTDI